MRFTRMIGCGFALAFVALSSSAAAGGAAPQQPAPFTSYSAGKADIIITQGSAEHLRFGMAAWGAKWAWAGVDGKTAVEQGATVGDLRVKVGQATIPVTFKASNPDPRRLVLTYDLKAGADAALTFIVVEMMPAKTLAGAVVIDASGKQSKANFPLSKAGLGQQVKTIQLADSAGAQTLITFDPPCEIASDGAARIILAKDKLSAGDTRKLAITINLPGATQWIPGLSEVPDEPGSDQWYTWQATGDSKGSVIGMADWFDAPAGKHGRIARQDDQLTYNGKPIKLWGLNVCYGSCAPEKELADKRADFYRKYGINAVRLHKYADGAGWSGIQSKNSCVEFDPAGLDRMDYFVARLKQAGIYVKLSPIFGTLKLAPADKQYVPFMDEFGAKKDRVETPHSAIHYSPELQRVLAMQMANLLKHKNPYTGLTYAEEPAIAFLEIINEQSIMFYTSMGPLKASPTLRKQVGQRFAAWLRKRYGGGQDKLAAAWGKDAFDCFNEIKAQGGESLDKENILPLGNPWYWDPEQLKGALASKRQRMLDTLEFLYTLQCEFFDNYVKAMRDAGYKGEILSSNWQAGRALSHFANLHSDYTVGTIDRHNYFGGASRANATMLARAGSGMFSSGMQQVSDRPFMLSEWIHVFPSEFGVEGPAILGAYGMGLQGWDVSFMFQNRDAAGFSAKLGADRWEVTAPQVLGAFPAISRQVLRGDVKQSEVVAARNVHAPSLFQGKLGFDDKVIQGYDDKELDSSKVPAQALAVARSVVTFTKDYTQTPAFDLKRFVKDGRLVSSTGQLAWKEAGGKPSTDEDAGSTGGYFTMDTAATKAVVGFAQGIRCDLGAVTLEPQSRFAALYVTALEKDQTIDSSRQLLVVAVARARNTGMKFSPGGDKMLAPGAAPIRMEPVKAKLSIRKPGTPTVVVLDHDGRPTDRTIPIENGAITIDGARDKTAYYLIKY